MKGRKQSMTIEQIHQAMLELRHLVNKYNLTKNQLRGYYECITSPYLVTYYNAAGQVPMCGGYHHRPTLEEALEQIDHRLRIKLAFSKAVVTYHGSEDIKDWEKPIIIVSGDGEILLGKELCDEAITKNLDVLKIA
jgi:hypothetical protein